MESKILISEFFYFRLKAANKPIVNSTSPVSVLKNLIKNRGIKGLYHGLDAALTRQVFYTTTRLGIYNKMFNDWKQAKGSELNFAQKSICSITAGFIGSIVGTPPDLILIRMQADNSLPEAERRNYKSVTHVIIITYFSIILKLKIKINRLSRKQYQKKE